MSASATEVVFLPGFDGNAQLRGEFVSAFAHRRPARAIGYPNRALGSLDGYRDYVASQVSPDSRPIVIAESFSGLVAARWAATDSRVAGLALCGAFARNPAPLVARLGSWAPSIARFAGSRMGDPRGTGWERDLPASIRALRLEVIAERLRLIANEDISAELSSLRAPVTLVQFEDDEVIGPRARRHLESVCHNARIVRLPGPHFNIEVNPIPCAGAIAPWLAPLFEKPVQAE